MLPKPKKPLINERFFKFTAGFILVLLLSFGVLLGTLYFEDEINGFIDDPSAESILPGSGA